jgi:hypothetical protein
MHSTWDVSAEGGNNGIFVDGGRYCHFNLYAESNTGNNYSLANDPHYYFVKNPDSTVIPVFEAGGTALGIDTRGAVMRQAPGLNGATGVRTKNFSSSDSLIHTSGTQIVTNSSGSTRGMALNFVSNMIVGEVVEIYKFEDSPGFTLSVPATFSIAGVTGGLAFPGAAATAFKVLTVKLLDGNIVWISETSVS